MSLWRVMTLQKNMVSYKNDYKPAIELRPHQLETLDKLSSGSILFGGVGSGKTLTALAFWQKYYFDYKLYVITTPKKRNEGDWQEEAKWLEIEDITVDSWNNITKYSSVNTKSFFIFDEQRAIGSGKWANTFVKIARKHPWILATGTPGDGWMDYVPVFLANNFFKYRTEFYDEHVEFDRYAKFPLIKKFHNESKLNSLRDKILIKMDFERETTRDRIYVDTDYDEEVYNKIMNTRWDPVKQVPISTPAQFASVLRRTVATYFDREFHARWIMQATPRIIVFYNFNYERDILISIANKLEKYWAEYNGHHHDPIPTTDEWIYLVNYRAGAEGWNCITTDTILFYSPNYSYKAMEQSEGRIDRMNTEYKVLRYYYLRSNSSIDKKIFKTIKERKEFNESAWVKEVNRHFRKQISRRTGQRNRSNNARSYRSQKRPQLQTRRT